MKKIAKIVFTISLGVIGLSSCALGELGSHECNYNVSKHSDEYHWNECSCGKIDIESLEAHDLNMVFVQDLTDILDGKMNVSCKDCTYEDQIDYTSEDTDVLDMIAKSLDDQIAELTSDDVELANTLYARYFYLGNSQQYVNSIDKLKMIATIDEEMDHKHSYTKYYDKNYHWDQCSCGLVIDDSKVEHTYTETIVKQATLEADGIKKYECECGYSYQESYKITEQEKDALKAADLVKRINALQDNDVATARLIEIDYDKLSEYAQSLVTNYDKVVLILNSDEINACMSAIKLIKLPQDSEVEITQARAKYDALSNEAKREVTNYDILTGAEQILEQYKSIDLTDLNTQQQAIINSAFAYYYQLTQIQYDQYTSRRNPAIYPEEANSYNYTYLDCSSYTNCCYYYLYDQNVIDKSQPQSVSTANVDTYAKDNYGTLDDVIFYATTSTLKSADRTEEKAAEIRAMLQPGDLYNYRHGDGGHIMIYLGVLADGNDYFLHCTGSAGAGTSDATAAGPYKRTSEDQTSHERTYGALALDKAQIVFEKAHSTESVAGTTNRYIFASANTSWSILRPLNRMNKKGYTMNSNAIARLLYPGLDIEKSVSINTYHSAANNTEITYTIKIKNQPKSATENTRNVNADIPYLYISETMPSNVEFVSASDGGALKSGVVTWQLGKLALGATKTITYTYKTSGEVGAKILDNKTYVNNIKTNTIRNSIKSSAVDIDKVTAALAATTASDKSFTEMIIDAYKKVTNVDLLATGAIAYKDGTTYKIDDEQILRQYVNSSYKRTTTTAIASLVPSGLFGGIKVRAADGSDNLNIRNLTPKILEPGDIIACEFNGEFEVYYFASLTQVYKLDSETKKPVLAYSTQSSVTGFVHTIPYYWSFTVVRPSLSVKFPA